MARKYRAIQQWNNWLLQFPGAEVLLAEKNFLSACLANYFGKQGLLIGVPAQQELLKASVAAHQVMLTPLVVKNHTIKIIESDLQELPIASGSVDLVLLPHVLEYLDNPRQLLSEACRIVKPEGHLVILGFNALSLWGMKKILLHPVTTPWTSHFISATTLKKWLALADFELVKQDTFVYRPPINHAEVYQKLKILEWVGRKCFRPLGGIYILIAKAKTIPLTPIRLRWQQTLGDARVTTLSGSSYYKNYFKGGR